MTAISCLIALCSALAGTSTLSGQVLDDRGQALAGARVFAEQGLGGMLLETQSTSDGRFRFDDVAPGGVGVFATANGFAFGGRHVNVAMAQNVDDLVIRLRRPGNIRGQVTDHKGHPVEDAHIVRVALLGEHKVGIPLTKLRPLGFTEPVSGADGSFSVSQLPEGENVALKVGHAQFAQEGVAGVAVGTSDLRIALYPGVLIQGDVVSREQNRPVASAAIVIRNAQPPHDTAVARTDALGTFSVRLKPGVYLYQSAGAGWRSPGWERLQVSGQPHQPRIRLIVAGSGAIHGSVRDAVSGTPIEGARLTLTTNGNMAGVFHTGPTGEYRMTVAEGSNMVRLETAPGYLPPKDASMGVQVTQGKSVGLPGLWLVPIPDFRLQVLDESLEEPVAGAVVTVLRPEQYGWHVTGEDGWVTLKVGALPADGRIVGRVEHPSKPLGALFGLTTSDAKESRVQLMPLGSVTGTVASAEGGPMKGAVVGAVFPGEEGEEALLLWRCVTNGDGAFRWEAAVPGIPQRCVAKAGAAETGESATYSLAPGATHDLGHIVVPEGEEGKSLASRVLRWQEGDLLCGRLPDKNEIRERPAVVLYCPADRAAIVIESLGVAQGLLGRSDLLFVVVVDGGFQRDNSPVPVLSGQPPATATTYVLAPGGRVIHETFGLPPLRLLQQIPAGG